MENFNNEEWTVVAPRRRREDRYGNGRIDGKTRLTSFYFTNFPDEVTLQELRYRFTRIGEVVDIFIPGKKNKLGKYFGFVRFKGITEIKFVEEKMKEIWYGTYKLWANAARFAKDGGVHNEYGGKKPISDGRIKESAKKLKRKNEAPERKRNIGWDRTRAGNLSYADAAGRQIGKNGEGQRSSDSNNIQKKQEEKREWRGLSFETVEEDRVWARKGLIGMVNHVDEVPLLQQKILDVGITTVKIIPMGGRKVYIQPLEDEDLWDLIKDAEEFFNHWFVKIKEWSPKEIASDRTIWMRLYGVPVHAWRENFFKKILESTGEVITPDEDTCKRRRFDYARVLIRTSALSFINQVEKVKIDEDFFVVRILEELNVSPTKAAGNQNLQQSEDEESNSQWWITQNMGEEEEGEVNSQNLEREYCAFNEFWEDGKNNVSGGAGRESQEILNSTVPKKATQLVTRYGERKDHHVYSIKQGTHSTTNDPLLLENIGVLFTSVMGSTQRPIVENTNWVGSGSKNSTRNNITMDCDQLSPKVSSTQHRICEEDSEQQQEQISVIPQMMNNDNQEINVGNNVQHQQQLFDPQDHEDGESSLMECSQKQNQSLSTKGNLISIQPEEQNQKMDELKKRRRRRIVPKMKDLARANSMKMKKKKRKQTKQRSTSNGNTVVSDSLNQVNISIDSSCSREISEWRKWVLLHEDPNEVASKVWEFGRNEGVIYSDDEGGVVKELEGIEIRDREKIVGKTSKENQGGESIMSGL
ncbi:zinc finger CCCH domain-containing protein [Trifolium repens]|jgi:hypothetical protein|nr:zinc finger CCCH domain-containing protein [Trifolium repens]